MLLAVHIFTKFLHLMVSSPKGTILIEVAWKESTKDNIWQEERKREREK
jgi:hypothetical protein